MTHKLLFYGIRGKALNWFVSYLKNRTQIVNLDGILSRSSTVLCGVPQGLVLRPLLFIKKYYINDMSNVSKITHLILFADDTNEFYSDNNFHSLCNVLNCEMQKLHKWFFVYTVKLNSWCLVTKFYQIILYWHWNWWWTNRKSNWIDSSMCFFFVDDDKKLSWKKHIHKINKKVENYLAFCIWLNSN